MCIERYLQIMELYLSKFQTTFKLNLFSNKLIYEALNRIKHYFHKSFGRIRRGLEQIVQVFTGNCGHIVATSCVVTYNK